MRILNAWSKAPSIEYMNYQRSSCRGGKKCRYRVEVQSAANHNKQEEEKTGYQQKLFEFASHRAPPNATARLGV